MSDALTPERVTQTPDATLAEVVDEDALLHELAALSPLAYDRRRESTAKLLGVRVGTLDTEVTARRSTQAEAEGVGTSVLFAEPAPWSDAVNGASLLVELSAFYTRYVVLPAGAADMLAVWTLHTYTHAAAQTTARVGIASPEKRCGKTTLLALMGAVVARPLPASNITPAALFRAIEQWQPTVLIDEADTFLRDNDELRGVLNAGHTRPTAYVIRTVGEHHEPRAFCVWAPVAIALIGTLPPTLADRAIVVSMRRKLPSEQVARLRLDRLDVAHTLRRQCLRWAQDTLAALQATDPTMPDSLHDRAADNWRPLCAIAEVAGEEWPARVRQAITALESDAREDEAAGILLLEDLRQLFVAQQTDRLTSAAMVEALKHMEERPWPEWRNARPITARQVARILVPFGIKPKTIKTGMEAHTAKGYLRDECVEAFARYLPVRSVTPSPGRNDADVQAQSSVTLPHQVTEAHGRKSAPENAGDGVTDCVRGLGKASACARPLHAGEALPPIISPDCGVSDVAALEGVSCHNGQQAVQSLHPQPPTLPYRANVQGELLPSARETTTKVWRQDI